METNQHLKPQGIAVLIALSLLVAAALASFIQMMKPEPPRALQHLNQISNNDVVWGVGTAGVFVMELKGASRQAVPPNYRPGAINHLVYLLSDREKYLAAHVLLLIFTQRPWENSGISQFVGVSVIHVGGDLQGNNEFLFKPDERFELMSEWSKWLRENGVDGSPAP